MFLMSFIRLGRKMVSTLAIISGSLFTLSAVLFVLVTIRISGVGINFAGVGVLLFYGILISYIGLKSFKGEKFSVREVEIPQYLISALLLMNSVLILTTLYWFFLRGGF